MTKTYPLAAVLSRGIAQAAFAGIAAVLDNSSLGGNAGDMPVFDVTPTNTSTTDQAGLNGIGSTASSNFLNIDASPFDIDAPLYLDPPASSGPFELFDVT